MQALKKGILIAVEGIDGSGKTTLIKELARMLKHQGFDVLATRQPGGSDCGNEIRGILKKDSLRICPRAEYLLFAADRAQHAHEILMPALHKRQIVISDRLTDSSLAYQGYGRKLPIDILKQINDWSMNNIKPDLVFFIDITRDEGFKRLLGRNETLTHFDKETELFFKNVIEGFKTIFHNRGEVIVLDANNNEEGLAQIAYEKIVQWIKNQKLLN